VDNAFRISAAGIAPDAPRAATVSGSKAILINTAGWEMICFVAIMPKLGVCVVDPVRDHDGVGQGDGVVDGVSDTESEPLSESLGAWLVLAERVKD
jgi:hypothetical protein